jgi:sporulation protein YlmC with PRC-barrel domain
LRKALLAAAAIAALATANASAQTATTTTDNPQNGTSAGKMSPTATPGMTANSTTANPTTMAPANTTQTAAQPVPNEGPSFITVQSNDMLSSNVVGLSIYNSQNNDIGKIQDIAFDSSKQVTGYILSVGGFLGMGTHYVAVNPGSIMVAYDAQNKAWKATMNATKDQLKSAPEFKYGGQWTASKS